MRDDFPLKVVDILAKRVGMRCSNPGCQLPTSGPCDESTKSVNVGVAAHITAASLGGPRFDPNLSREERSSIENGIWLCQTCSKLIDNDTIRYTINSLRNWKRDAEKAARNAIESPNQYKENLASSVNRAQEQTTNIPLNIDDSFSGSSEEFGHLCRKIVLDLKSGKKHIISCSYEKLNEFKEILENPSKSSVDVVEIAEYCRNKKQKGQYISDVAQSLFSDSIQKFWGTYLVKESDWRSAFKGIFTTFTQKNVAGLTKIDVWRTSPPKESAPIFVSKEELEDILTKRGFNDKRHLAFGAGWVAADELPSELIIAKVMPRILISLKAPWKKISLEQFDLALPISSWHIGLG
jgi:hypothetical protein